MNTSPSFTDNHPISFDRTSAQSEPTNTQEPVQGHLAGVPIQSVSTHESLTSYLPRPIPPQERTSNLDYFMGLIANPVRTLDAVIGSLSSASIDSTSVLLPDDLVEQRDALSALNNSLMNTARVLDSPHINRTLPEYETYKTAFIKTAQSFNRAWNILNSEANRHSNTWNDFFTALNQASNDNHTLTTASRAFSDAQRLQSLATPNGAYRVSAAEAALAGIHPPPDARGPIAIPHAISIAYGTPADSKISAQQAKSDKNPHGLSVVEAEEARPDDQSPLVPAQNLLTNQEIAVLIEQRAQAYNTANEKAP